MIHHAAATIAPLSQGTQIRSHLTEPVFVADVVIVIEPMFTTSICDWRRAPAWVDRSTTTAPPGLAVKCVPIGAAMIDVAVPSEVAEPVPTVGAVPIETVHAWF